MRKNWENGEKIGKIWGYFKEFKMVRKFFEGILNGEGKGNERAFTSRFKRMTTFLYYLLGF
jgi:hypothetical protein